MSTPVSLATGAGGAREPIRRAPEAAPPVEDGGEPLRPLARDAHAAGSEKNGRALSTVGLVTTVANAGASTTYEINRHQNRSNSLEPNGPKTAKGTPNHYRLGLIGDLQQTNTNINRLNTTNAPFKDFLKVKGDLTATQISSTMTKEKRHWTSNISHHESEASWNRSRASSLETDALFATDSKDSKGNVTESASSKRWRLMNEAASHRRTADSHDESAAIGRQRLKAVNAYISGKNKDPHVLKTAVTRRVETTNGKIRSLKGEADGLTTKIKREPFRETTFQKGGRVAIGVLSTAGAAIEGYSAYRSYQKGNDAAAMLHATSAIGHGILAGGTFMRTPAGAITGAVLSTLGAVGAQFAEQ